MNRQRPFLLADQGRADELVEVVGCRRFEDTFAFSMVIEGQQAGERVLDVFTGLRGTLAESSLTNATITRAAMITKRVTTQDGVEDQSLDWHLDGVDLVVQNTLDGQRLLPVLNEAFDLRLTNAELRERAQGDAGPPPRAAAPAGHRRGHGCGASGDLLR